MPPTPTRVRSDPTRSRSRRTTSSDRWVSGRPLRPPAPTCSTRDLGVASPSRLMVGTRLVGATAYGREDRLELLDRLQVAEAGGVGRGDVDDEVVGEGGEEPRRLLVVAGSLVLRHDLGLADVDAQDGATEERGGALLFSDLMLPTPRSRSQPPGDHLGAVVVEAHPVDDGAV